MKKFDLERALAGDKVVTRNGKEVTQLHSFDRTNGDSVFGVINGGVYSWSERGVFHVITPSGRDLFMAPKQLSGFVCIYMNSEGRRYTNSFDRVEQADLYESTTYKEVARIDLSQFEEGHGL